MTSHLHLLMQGHPLGDQFRMLHFNVTLLNSKATSFLAELPEKDKPDDA